MKRILVIFAAFLVSAGLLLVLAFFAPLPIPYYQDFSVMYFTDKTLLQGISIYDYDAQLPLIRAWTRPDFTFHPFPYPPWYVLATIYLGWLPIQVAARLWFFLNLGMLSCMVWLLTPGWKVIPRILAAAAAILFIPAFGLMIVGQYSMPILLGAALFVYAARRKLPFWAALGLLLMTFKPHIGFIICLAGFIWLIFERSAFSRRAILYTILGGLFLVAVGFLADPVWPLDYLASLGRYRYLPGVQAGSQSASLAVAVIKLTNLRPVTIPAAGLSLILILGLGLLLFLRFRSHLQDVFAMVSLAAVMTLLVDPYLLNYDYCLLLIPFFWLLLHRDRPRQLTKWDGLLLALYLLPWPAMLFGEDGNILLALAALMTFFLILRRPVLSSPVGIDAPA